MRLVQLDGDFSVAQYPPTAALGQIFSRGFCSITRTSAEVSVVCETDLLPAGARKVENGWTLLEVDGAFDFDVTGVISAISKALADDDISLFVISTYNTDYVLVKRDILHKAAIALAKSGFKVDF